jgi:monoamine oxidase
MIDIGIVGGGPGGLMAAWYVKKKMAGIARATLFEATHRLGGKIRTRRFDSAPALYEAGVAEIYDYSRTGPDPLKELITGACGLSITPIDGEAVAMDGAFFNSPADLEDRYGAATTAAIHDFRALCARMMSPFTYYEGAGKDDNGHPWSRMTARELLDGLIHDDKARQVIKVMSRSDIASELHLTNGLNALKNFLMDVDGYIELYSIDGGNERLVAELSKLHDAEIRLGTRINRISRASDGGYLLDIEKGMERETRRFDLVLVCLPHNWLQTVTFDGAKLARAVQAHVAHFDRPAHYLRISAMFETPFWRDHVRGAWFMSESFGGCCVYDEGARHDTAGKGVLNWLVPGSDVLAWVNLSDRELVEHAIATLPDVVRDAAHDQLVEFRTHRYLSSVNALPGGMPVRDQKKNHVPEPGEHPGLFLIGDYMFDSTLNGLLDSADLATDLAVSHLVRLRYESGEAHEAARREQGVVGLPPPSRKIDGTYFRNYRGAGPYETAWRRFANPDHLADCFRTAFGADVGSRILVAGSASGQLVGALREIGFDAWGIENNGSIHARTPESLRPFNLFGSVLDLPFEDSAFDVIYETCLCHVSERRISWALDEMRRVCRLGVMFGSVTSDLTPAVLDRHDLLRGVKRLGTWWEWSEDFYNADFELAIQDNSTLDALWERTVAAGRGPGNWYDEPEALRYSFFRKIAEEPEAASLKAAAAAEREVR